MKHTNVKGLFTTLKGKEYYKIESYHEMQPFFINLSTSSNLWMFLSSGGALTAGRQDASQALFPYETDDKIHLNSSTGPKTLVRLESDEAKLWEVFARSYVSPYAFKRNLYKSLDGGAVGFEEKNETLGLSFFYRWESSGKFGLVRSCTLTNEGSAPAQGSLLDGLVNILPFGIPQMMAATSSCLTDAYKAGEIELNLAIYSMTTKINDSPEPVEILRANAAWSTGERAALSLNDLSLDSFARGENPGTDTRVNGRKCAYLALRKFSLKPGESLSWKIVIDSGLSHGDLSLLQKDLAGKNSQALEALVDQDIARDTAELVRIMGIADAFQCTGDHIASAHHYMNVLYNNMRGGVFIDGYSFDPAELERFAGVCDRDLPQKEKQFFQDIKNAKDVVALKNMAFAAGKPALIRLVLEFLPLCFSRRHGDPSRPWNRFFIRVKDAKGKYLYHYEGNWRDIFQNWEALCLSFPEYLENVIAKFLNASTADGHNPYRISAEGIDWEKPAPGEEFGGLGYWGDHQIVYLTRLLDAMGAHNPSGLDRLMASEIFTYANIPYEIAPYGDIIKNSKETIRFNIEKDNAISKIAEARGSDGRLMLSKDGKEVYLVSFWEKLLVPVFAKLSNLVPGGGIWMNTQRPEWNDANNAIVGIGLSMVTVYQLYRHLDLCAQLLGEGEAVSVSKEVKTWFTDLVRIYGKYAGQLGSGDGKVQRAVLDEAGRAFETYRTKLYKEGFSGKDTLSRAEIQSFFQTARAYLEYTIDKNEAGGIYHAYNLLKLSDQSLDVAPLFPMLEGQTAVLGSGRLGPEKSLSLIETMEKSGLYSQDHDTFFLYPIKNLKSFMGKNIIPPEAAASKLIQALLSDPVQEIFCKDAEGQVRFNDAICQAKDLAAALDQLSLDSKWADLVKAEKAQLVALFDQVFLHSEFTGRSGVMYKYEGIGSIYWHQNSKFLLSVQESFASAMTSATAPALRQAYYRTRQGLGFNKEPSLWGALPLEPYSHTPYKMPAQQPGMTGQVKEEIITRRLELGLLVKDGIISINPALLRREEFLSEPATFRYIGEKGGFEEIPLERGMLGYTICQTPVVYRLGSGNSMEAQLKGGSVEKSEGLSVSAALSRSIFDRDGKVEKLVVHIKESDLT